MSYKSNMYFRSFMEFSHDIAAGVYPGAVLVAWMIRRQVSVASPSAESAVRLASVSLWLILLGSLVVLGVTGVFRLTYWKLNIRAGFLDMKRNMVALKHAAFVLLLLVSIAFTFTVLPG